MTRPILIASWAKHGNVGDDLLLAQVQSDLAVETTPIFDPGYLRDSVEAGALVWPTDKALLSPLARLRLRAVAADHAAVVLVGGFLSDDRTIRTLIRWALRLRILGLPVVTAGCGFGPATTHLGRRLLRDIGGRFCEPACFRTEADAADFRWLIPGVRATVVADPVSRHKPSGDRSSPRSGTVVSLPPSMPFHTGRPAESDPAAAISQLLESLPVPHSFVPFQESAPGVDSDARAWDRLGLPVVAPRDAAHALELVARAEVVVAGRLHAALAAVVTGTPLIAIEYHRKFGTLMPFGVTPVSWRDIRSATPVVPAQTSVEMSQRYELALAEQLTHVDLPR